VLVGIDFVAALENPGGQDDVIIEPGDELVVPAYDATVLVQGAVAFEARVIYRQGRSVRDYIGEAGGTLPEVDVSRISVLYASGQRATVGMTIWWKSYPDVEPSSTIYVPAKVGFCGHQLGGRHHHVRLRGERAQRPSSSSSTASAPDQAAGMTRVRRP
jgi:hypothetical protein